MEVYIDTLQLIAEPKEGNNQFKNKKQPELLENWTVWKCNNQGVKHSSRLVGEVEMGNRGCEDVR